MNILGQPVSPTLKVSSGPCGILGIGGFLLNYLTLEDGTDTLLQNVGN